MIKVLAIFQMFLSLRSYKFLVQTISVVSRVEFFAQNDVRVGLQWGDFLGKCSSKLLRLFGLHWASKGVKWCKSEGVKNKLTPHSYIFFGRPRGVIWCKSEGVKDKLPPNTYIVLPPLADQKRCKSGGLICLLPPHSYTILPPLADQKRCKSGGYFFFYPLTLAPFYPPWNPNAAQKDVRVLSYNFLKNPLIAAPLLHHFPALAAQLLHHFIPPPQSNSYIILHPQPYIALAPIPEDCQS